MQARDLTSQERMWASLAHAILFLNILQIIFATILTMGIWLFKRRASTYVGFQALQAFIFQAVVVFLSVILDGLAGYGAFLAIMGPGVGYAAYGAYRCNQGEDFRYVWIGSFLASLKPRGK